MTFWIEHCVKIIIFILNLSLFAATLIERTDYFVIFNSKWYKHVALLHDRPVKHSTYRSMEKVLQYYATIDCKGDGLVYKEDC